LEVGPFGYLRVYVEGKELMDFLGQNFIPSGFQALLLENIV